MSNSHLDSKYWPTLAVRLAPLDPWPTTNPHASFHRFSSLPIELRLKIWQHTFRGRIVALNLDFGSLTPGASPETLRAAPVNYFDNLSSHFPVTLWVNREARAETLRWYKDLFPGGELSSKPVYFCAERDTLAVYFCNKERNIQGGGMLNSYAQRMEVLAEYAPGWTGMVRSVVLPRVVLESAGEWEEGEESVRERLRGLLGLERLEEVLLVGQRWKKGWNNGMDVVGNRREAERRLRGLFAEREEGKQRRVPRVEFFEENFRLPLFRDELEMAYKLRDHECWDLMEAAACRKWFESDF
ncbi:hypothetical protein CJF31_00010271 [Rutstroemia sp. NJR-2017a BVV2]|nr:hypothetical protein CJF31_00010271 [Rutstroemia sp. NJR-2017a BVV2]